MFTGLIEERGQLVNVLDYGNSFKMTIAADKVLKDISIGDSIATNGVCLTVTEFDDSSFTVDVMPETLRTSSLSKLTRGDYVNLERAMQLGGRLGGHMVSGHIDGTGKIIQIYDEGNARVFVLSADKNILKYIVKKGSIAIDGASLTVFDIDDRSFSVSIIPHTMEETVLEFKTIGSTVNLENDMVGKYVEKLLLHGSSDCQYMETNEGDQEKMDSSKEKINEDFLRQNGFI